VAVVAEIIVCGLVLMYVEGYGTNEGLPGLSFFAI